MSKKFIVLIGILVYLMGISHEPIQAAKVIPPKTISPEIHIVGAERDSKDIESVLAMIADLVSASNQHHLEGVLKHYSPRFVSGDSLNLDEIQQLIQETWKIYPDIRYETKTVEIRLNGDWATVESIDQAKATAVSDSPISKTSGYLESRSRGMLFLKRIGKTWEIVSDYTVYENATIFYGDAKNMKVALSTPDQVFSGEPYTAKIDVALPSGSFAIATISKEPLVFPQLKPEEKFRSLSEDHDALERVFQANITNNNEIVTATVGLTQIGQDEQERPTIQLSGIATIVKRVNVLPKSKFTERQASNEMVKRSASGHIDLSQKASPKKEGETPILSKQGLTPEELEENAPKAPLPNPLPPGNE